MMMNMFGIQNISAAKLLLVNTMAVVTLSLPKCFEITDVRQPETALVEEVINIEVDVNRCAHCENNGTTVIGHFQILNSAKRTYTGAKGSAEKQSENQRQEQEKNGCDWNRIISIKD